MSKRILSRRKLPSVEFGNKGNVYHLHYDSEQSPNSESRVSLSEKRDALGMRRLYVDWRFSDFDVESAAGSIKLLNASFIKSDVGKLLNEHESLPAIIRSQVHVGSHHLGLTRMGATPHQGVVDSNCRVFDTNNLFIASSSVFPTSSFANPTLTIVALTIRLADHLTTLLDDR
jgi:choline dehydrogenase-like flavoprotein